MMTLCERSVWRRMLPLCLLLAGPAAAPSAALAASPAKSVLLENGLRVVAVEDHRAPIVTHIIAYRVGAADDPEGASGAAHYLEHMMFKTAGGLKAGEYVARVARHGGSTNAVTSHDTTIYHARVPISELARLMEMEAERMSHLDILPAEFEAERSVIQAERRGRIEAAPLNILVEAAASLLHFAHPYRRPAIGWAHEIATLKREHLVALYERYYAPHNAVVVVVGDMAAAEVFALAKQVYGRVRYNPDAAETTRSKDPPYKVVRRLTLADARISAPLLYRVFSVPSYISGERRDALSLDVLATVLAHRSFGRLAHNALQDLASVDGGYTGLSRDEGRLAVVLAGRPGVELARLERHLDAAIGELQTSGITQEELDTAVSVLKARRSFDLDDQLALARAYAETVALGGSIDDVERYDGELHSVSLDDVKRASQKYLVPERSVTGVLVPMQTHPGTSGVETARRQP